MSVLNLGKLGCVQIKVTIIQWFFRLTYLPIFLLSILSCIQFFLWDRSVGGNQISLNVFSLTPQRRIVHSIALG